MKKVGIIILSLALLLGSIPQTVSAAEGSTFEVDLNAYLGEISAERGFNITKADLEAHLSTYETKLSNFTTVEELRTTLGEVIKADLSNLGSLYENYKLDETALTKLLADNGEELKDYVYISELDYALIFYTYDDTFEREPDFDAKLITYLASISEVRGIEVTKERLEEALSIYGTKLDSFETVEDVKDYMGEVIKEDLSNLSPIYDAYRIDQKTLLDLLEKDGKSIDDFIYVYDLATVADDTNSDIPILDESMLTDLLNVLDISDAELNKIEAYMTSHESYYADPVFLEAFNSWTERISSFEEFDGVEALNQEQAKQVAEYFNELFRIMKLNPVFSVIRNGQETVMSFEELVLQSDFDYKTVELKVTIFGTDGTLLADFLVSSDFIDYLSGNQSSFAPRTVSGAKLPKTATNHIPSAILGGLLMVVGILMYKKVRNVKKKAV